LRSPDEEIANSDVNFVSLFNVAGGPAISVPAGFDSNHLPIGLQLAGRPFADATVLAAAVGFQRATEWHRHFPQFGELP
jgi:Asp-tRNA(Asn)/Glu-tRNA(Gln) amidotransferase A subunit family amidase